MREPIREERLSLISASDGSFASHSNALLAAGRAGKQCQSPISRSHLLNRIRFKYFHQADFIREDVAKYIRKRHGISRLQALQAPKMMLIIVRSENQIIRMRASAVTSGRNFQSLITPLGHHRQLQIKTGNPQQADIVLTVD